MYETFEHTADVGLRIRAATLNELFADAARGLFSLLAPGAGGAVQSAGAVPGEAVSIALAGHAPDELLRDWLAELLYTFHVRRLVFTAFDVDVRNDGLTATVRGEPLDATRDAGGVEVKAVTWHALQVQRTAAGWLAEVIVDI